MKRLVLDVIMYQNQYYRRMILTHSLKRDSSENLINKTWLFTAIEQRVRSSPLCVWSLFICFSDWNFDNTEEEVAVAASQHPAGGYNGAYGRFKRDKNKYKGRVIIKATERALRAFQNDVSVAPHRLDSSGCLAKQCLIKSQWVFFLFTACFHRPQKTSLN